MQYRVEDFLTHLVYIARWVVLAIPGTGFLKIVRRLLPAKDGKDNIVLAMLISQGVLGALVFFIDRWIFR